MRYSVCSAKKLDLQPNEPLEEKKWREEQEQKEGVKEFCTVKWTQWPVHSAKKPDLQPNKPLEQEEREETKTKGKREKGRLGAEMANSRALKNWYQ